MKEIVIGRKEDRKRFYTELLKKPDTFQLIQTSK